MIYSYSIYIADPEYYPVQASFGPEPLSADDEESAIEAVFKAMRNHEHEDCEIYAMLWDDKGTLCAKLVR